MYAVKANRQYTITEAEADSYRDEGYDIIAEDGTTVLQTGKGKTVPYAKYQEALDQSTDQQAQIVELQAQVAALQAQLDAAGGKKKE